MKNNLGDPVTLIEIKEAVRQKKSMEFVSKAKQVNLDKPDIQNYLKQGGTITLPPLNNKSEIFQALWNIDTPNESSKWDCIILLTYLNDGQIFYDLIDGDDYLVTIKF